MAEYITRIADARGVEHLYSADPFPGSQGYDLFLEVAEVLGGPVGQVLKLIIPMLAKAAKTGQDFSIADALSGSGVDLSTLPEMLERAPRVLIERGGSEFAMRLLANTRRSMKPADQAKEGDLESLGDEAMFDQAYAGNVFEVWKAMLWATEVNWAPFSTGDIRNWSALLPLLGASTPATPKPRKTGSGGRASRKKRSAGRR